jgi:Arc/MetJ-type ribon-helix-helix transcriptional regulator
MAKKRLSASVDADLIEEAHAAVAAGRYPNVSAWVNEALKKHSDRQQKLEAMSEAIAAYEAEFGEITEEDMERTDRWIKETAITTGRRGGTKRRGAA